MMLEIVNSKPGRKVDLQTVTANLQFSPCASTLKGFVKLLPQFNLHCVDF